MIVYSVPYLVLLENTNCWSGMLQSPGPSGTRSRKLPSKQVVGPLSWTGKHIKSWLEFFRTFDLCETNGLLVPIERTERPFQSIVHVS